MEVNLKLKRITIMGVLAAFLIVFSVTPIGSIPVGPLCITLNVIPVAIAAVILGPFGGMFMGAIFGILSLLQCYGLGVPSPFGAILARDNILSAVTVCVISRMLAGFCVGFINKFFSKKVNINISSVITGLFAALLNTLFFLVAFLIFFSNNEYVVQMAGERNVLVFMLDIVGLNAVVEMMISSIVTGLIGMILYKFKIIERHNLKV